MRVAIIGRTEILYDTAVKLIADGHQITCILTAKEAPEYLKKTEDFKALSEKLNVPFGSSSKINEYENFLKNSHSDIAVSINYSGVIPKNITDLFPLGILNAHGGDLPRYRGNACQAWAIINGEDRIGLCIHRMIGGELDSGDIISRSFIEINIKTKIGQIMNWICETTPTLFSQALKHLEKNPKFILEQQSKNPKDALRCYPRKPEDGRINWKDSAINILRLINASSKPYAGAFCFFDNDKIIIWEAELAPDENYLGIPGQLASINESYVDVLTGNGKLRILSIEKNGALLAPSQLTNSTRKRFE